MRLPRPRAVVLAVLAAVVLGNAVVYAHAWRFTQFVAEGRRTPNPDSLSAFGRLGALLTGVNVPRPRLRATPDASMNAEELRVGPIATWVLPRRADPSRDAPLPDAAIGNRPGDTALLFHGYGGARSDLIGEGAWFQAHGLTAVRWARRRSSAPSGCSG